MASYARKNAIRFLPTLENKNEVPKELQKLHRVILENSPKSVEFWSDLKTDFMKDIRHRYFHFSAYYGSSFGANEPQFSNDDRVNGRRQRVIQNG